jgi:hypothetical protein
LRNRAPTTGLITMSATLSVDLTLKNASSTSSIFSPGDRLLGVGGSSNPNPSPNSNPNPSLATGFLGLDGRLPMSP